MSEFLLHPDALGDLEEIWEFIAADNLVAADRSIEEIYQAIRSLAQFLKWARFALSWHRGISASIQSETF